MGLRKQDRCIPGLTRPTSLFPNPSARHHFIVLFYQKTREGCGCFWGLSGSSGGKFRENCWKNLSRIAKCYTFWVFGHREKQTCWKNWVHTGLDLVPTFRAGCFLKSTVPAFSSFSDSNCCYHSGAPEKPKQLTRARK